MDGPLDTVFLNGPVFTSDSGRSRADAVAVQAGRIAAVGTADEIGAGIGPGTDIIDLGGRLLVAGFQDAHVHPVTAGLDRLRCDLLELADLGSAVAAVRHYRAGHPDVEWVRGGGWKFDWFPGGLAPVELLDDLIPDRPAYLEVADGHAAWVNSRALQLAGIDAGTPDPADGRIERNPDGSPQGTLQEGAMALVGRLLPANTVDELDRALVEAQAYLFSFGVTAWQDAWVTRELHDTYRRLAADGRLRAQVRGALWWNRERGPEQIEELEELRRQSVPGYLAGSIKLMLDGVCENFTARVLDPYLDVTGAPTGNVGIDFLDPETLPDIVTEVMARGFQPHFHALGDAAVRAALDAVAAARRALGDADVRPHLAHIQIVHPADVRRFRTLNVSANAQPLWACGDETMRTLTVPFLGGSRAAQQYPFGDLVRAGAHLAMGSDWAVSTPDVMAQIGVAVTRQVPGDGASEPFLPEQRLTLDDALSAFTVGSAYVNFLDNERGSITPGKIADLAVLGGNPFESGGTAGMAVDLTMVAGEIVFAR